jgi:hypothetical protein
LRRRWREQIVGRGGASRPDRCQDAATSARDILIARAGEALLELGGAITAEYEVRMAVDEGRGDPAAVQ